MTFALTKYIFPLEEKVLISKHMGYTLDNPRTADEIEIVKSFITETLKEEGRDKDSRVAPLLLRYNLSLNDLQEELQKTDINCYALKFYSERSEVPVVDILAESWIIVRFKIDKEFSRIFKDRDTLFDIILGNKEKTTYAKDFDLLANYCHIVSSLCNNIKGYHGESFLLQENPYEIFFVSSYNKGVKDAIEDTVGHNFILKHKNRATSWQYWLDSRESLIENCKRLETLLIQEKIIESGKKIRSSQKQSPKQKIFHIGSRLRTAYMHLSDPELMLLLLVSVLEYLITRNPDTSKFNVEDSISRQFKLKCAVLIHKYNQEYDLLELSQELGMIYSQRSDLAHGNYKEDFDIKEIVDSVYLLYVFIN